MHCIRGAVCQLLEIICVEGELGEDCHLRPRGEGNTIFMHALQASWCGCAVDLEAMFLNSGAGSKVLLRACSINESARMINTSRNGGVCPNLEKCCVIAKALSCCVQGPCETGETGPTLAWQMCLFVQNW